MDDRREDKLCAPLASQPGYFFSVSTGSFELVGAHEHNLVKCSDFEYTYRQPEDSTSLPEAVKEAFLKRVSKFSLKNVLKRNFPTLGSLNHYKINQDLPSDMVAGLTAGITMIPQGMAFATLATLPPIVGLYISLFASITYFLFGSARQLSWGCVAVLSIMIGNILDRYESKVQGSLGDDSSCGGVFSSDAATFTPTVPNVTYVSTNGIGLFDNTTTVTAFHHTPGAVSVDRKIEVAGAVTLISGIILAVLGKLGLGKVTSYMSDYLVTSFTVGVSVHVVSSQLKTVLGLDFPRQDGMFKLIKHWIAMLSNIQHTNLATVIISVLSMLIIYLVKRFVNEKYKAKLRIPVPVELFVVIALTVVTTFTELNKKFSVGVVEDIPVGVPKPRIPDLSLGAEYVTDGMMIIIVSFTQTVAMAKLIGLKYNYRVDSNQEMFACGMVSIVCSIFSGYISGASVSRSLVQDSAGGKTQVASLFAAGLVLLVIMVIGPYFYYLPKCVLAAIVIVNLRSVMLKFLTVPDLWRKSRTDTLIWIITCAATIILDADIGLLVGIVASLLLVLIQSQIATVCVLGQLPLSEKCSIWRSKDKYFGAKETDGIKVLEISSPIYFVNAEIISGMVYKLTGVNPLKKRKELSESSKRKPAETKDKECDDREESISLQNGEITSDNIDKKPEEQVQEGYREKSKTETDSKLLCDFARHDSTFDAVPFHSLVLDLSSVTYIDLMGVGAIEFLISEYKTVGITIYISNVHENCFNILHKSGFMNKHGNQVFLTIQAAIQQASRRE
ncbi:hypothetical protein BaRGS_00026750 [Batillaria attramentaria]|uniref:STAS domain-containing protein n=1 Tax=Batillaria attramentaria TaxID=370345 RepID=A0ABD0K4Q6_9CAEN